VVKLKGEIGCPLCRQALPAAFFGPSAAAAPPGAGPWGDLPTRGGAVALATVILIEVALSATFFYLAHTTKEDSGAYWVLAILATTALIPVGIWLERRSIPGREAQMSPAGFPIWFVPKAAVKLADNEKISLWEPSVLRSRRGMLKLEDKAISLSGHWKASLVGDLFGGGVIGEWLVKPLILRERSEVVPIQAVRGLLVRTRMDRRTYHLLQQRNSNLVEVHIFTLNPKETQNLSGPSLDDALKAFIPPRLWREEPAG
jgi:hypothetical protein